MFDDFVDSTIVRALLSYDANYGDDFKIECPTGSGNLLTHYPVAEKISRQLAKIFLQGKDGQRPVYGCTQKFQKDPHCRDLVLFYADFHGDNAARLGASHQTGWTGLVARMMHLFATTSAERVFQLRKIAAVVNVHKSKGRDFVGVRQ